VNTYKGKNLNEKKKFTANYLNSFFATKKIYTK
jgi:hypothetical protein